VEVSPLTSTMYHSSKLACGQPVCQNGYRGQNDLHSCDSSECLHHYSDVRITMKRPERLVAIAVAALSVVALSGCVTDGASGGGGAGGSANSTLSIGSTVAPQSW